MWLLSMYLLTILCVNGMKALIMDKELNEFLIGPALFCFVCRCNHSCQPNAEWSFIKKGQKIQIALKAVKGIKAKNEILISYFSDFHSFRPREFRQSHLIKAWNFKCFCLRCKQKKDDLRRFDHEQNGVLAEAKFIKSEFWSNLNACNLSKYGSKQRHSYTK